MCEIPEMWQGTFNEELVLKDMINPKVGSLYGFVVPTGTPPLTLIFGPKRNRVKGKTVL